MISGDESKIMKTFSPLLFTPNTSKPHAAGSAYGKEKGGKSVDIRFPGGWICGKKTSLGGPAIAIHAFTLR